MTGDSVYRHLLDVKERRGAAFMLLVDPDKTSESACLEIAETAELNGVDAIMVGTSYMLNLNFAATVKQIKQAASVPVIVFPGSFAHIVPHADAVLFTSLLSGRNAEYLIAEQVKGAPLVKRFGLEAIPTGYLLIESGPLTAVQFISGTLPIPRSKNDIACGHALAAQYMGMKIVYLEAGSGAQQAVPVSMVGEVSAYVDLPVMVGGGLKTPDDCAERVDAGASLIVVGNHLENKIDVGLTKEMAAAIHNRESLLV